MKEKLSLLLAALAGILPAYAMRQVFVLNLHRLLPPAPEGWMLSREATRAFITDLPFYIHALNSLSWLLAAAAGCVLAVRLAPKGRLLPGYAVILILLYLYDWAAMYSLYPLWTMALDIALLTAGATAGLALGRRWYAARYCSARR